MTDFQILWLIAGAILGYWIPDAILTKCKVRTPWSFNVSMAFVGALITYTIFR